MKIDRNLKILIGIAIISVIGTGVVGINTQSEIEKLIPTSAIQTAPTARGATLIINDGTGRQEFKFGLKEKTTVFDLLKQTGIDIDYTEYGVGIFIDAIGGVKNDRGKKMNWMYYVNGERAKVGAGKYIVKPADIIEWRYEKVEW